MFFFFFFSKMTANGIDMLVKDGKKELVALSFDLNLFDMIEQQLEQLSQLAKQNNDVASATLLSMIRVNMDEKQNNMIRKLTRLKETLSEIDEETDRLQ